MDNPENATRLRTLMIIGSILAIVAVLVMGVGIAMVMSTNNDDSMPITVLTGTSGLLTAFAGGRLIYKGWQGEKWRGEFERAATDLKYGTLLTLGALAVSVIAFFVIGSNAVEVLIPAAVALQGPVAMAIVSGYLRRPIR